MRKISQSNGQAAVEFVAIAPLLVVVLLCGWQLVVAGHAWWKLAEVARLTARAHHVAQQRGDRDELRQSRKLATQLLSGSPADARRVVKLPGGALKVTTRIPLVAPFRAALGSGPKISATSRMHP